MPARRATAHRHTTNNRAEIESSSLCGRRSCLEVFAPRGIVAWTGLDISSFDDPAPASGETAVCPRCGNEALIGDRSGYPITAEFLNRMNQPWFERTIIRKSAGKT